MHSRCIPRASELGVPQAYSELAPSATARHLTPARSEIFLTQCSLSGRQLPGEAPNRQRLRRWTLFLRASSSCRPGFNDFTETVSVVTCKNSTIVCHAHRSGAPYLVNPLRNKSLARDQRRFHPLSPFNSFSPVRVTRSLPSFAKELSGRSADA